MTDERDESARASERRFQDDVARKAERRRRAQQEGERSIWFSLGMFGLVGWSVAIPTLLGLAAGVWLDHAYPGGRVSWTLTLLAVGAVAGCANAWHWVKNESRDR
jgi:ATP synthase protein I